MSKHRTKLVSSQQQAEKLLRQLTLELCVSGLFFFFPKKRKGKRKGVVSEVKNQLCWHFPEKYGIVTLTAPKQDFLCDTSTRTQLSTILCQTLIRGKKVINRELQSIK